LSAVVFFLESELFAWYSAPVNALPGGLALRRQAKTGKMRALQSGRI